MRNYKLAVDLERAAEITNILITSIEEINPGTLIVKFGSNNGQQTSCPSENNRCVCHSLCCLSLNILSLHKQRVEVCILYGVDDRVAWRPQTLPGPASKLQIRNVLFQT